MSNEKVIDGILVRVGDRVTVDLYYENNTSYWKHRKEATGVVDSDFTVSLDEPHEDMVCAFYFSDDNKRFILLSNDTTGEGVKPEKTGYTITIEVFSLADLKKILGAISNEILEHTTVVNND